MMQNNVLAMPEVDFILMGRTLFFHLLAKFSLKN